MTDIEPVHRWAYREGEDPIEWSAFLAALHIKARDEARAGQLAPGAPLTLLQLDNTAVGRRIIASLLDAGWTPPAAHQQEAGETA
jgi:hypothetical protein